MSHHALERQYPWLYPITLLFVGTIFVLLTMVTMGAFFKRQRQKRLHALKDYVFPESYRDEVTRRYLHLSEEDVNLAFEQLRFYFGICLAKKPVSVAMPSRIVDTCWHVFICNTREYRRFCDDVFGDFLHHEAWTEANLTVQSELIEVVEDQEKEAMSEELKTQQRLEFRNQLAAARIYQWAAEMEGKEQISISTAVPLLFRIDEELAISDGFLYSKDVTEFLAKYNLKAAESEAASLNLAAAGSDGAACGDGGGAAACGGCGGSI
jgi:hypothetical protein